LSVTALEFPGRKVLESGLIFARTIPSAIAKEWKRACGGQIRRRLRFKIAAPDGAPSRVTDPGLVSWLEGIAACPAIVQAGYGGGLVANDWRGLFGPKRGERSTA